MAYQNKFLFRETLADTGVMPTTGYIYSSPDIICHIQVADAQTFFTNNYNSDPNERVNMGTVNNFIYARVKNLDASTELLKGYVNVYRSNSSLFMQPSLWSKTPLRTVNNNIYLEVISNIQGQIVVGSDIFVLSGLNNNYFCMMGIVSDSKEPTYPKEDFKTYDDFVYWLRTNQSVCARNLSLEYNCQKLDYERLDEFSNPEAKEALIFFLITAKNFDNGTKFGVVCEPLNLKAEAIFDSSSPNNMISTVAMVPSKFMGYIKTYGILPTGKMIWPANAEIEIETYTPLSPTAKSYQFAVDPLKLNIQRNQLNLVNESQKLVKLGSCRSVFNVI